MKNTNEGEEEIDNFNFQEVYTNQVVELKAEAISCFERLMSTDLQNPKEVFKTFQTTEKLISQFKYLSKKYLIIDTSTMSEVEETHNPAENYLQRNQEPNREPLEVSLSIKKVKEHDQTKKKGWLRNRLFDKEDVLALIFREPHRLQEPQELPRRSSQRKTNPLRE